MGASMLTLGILLTLKDQVSPSLDKLKKDLGGLQELSSKMVKAGVVLSGVGMATQGASSGIRGFIKEVAAGAGELDNLRALLLTIPGMTEKMADSAMANGQKWATTHGDSVATYVDSLYETIGSLGVDKFTEATQGTEKAMQLARATRGQAGESAKLMTQLWSNFGGTLASVADKLTYTQNAFQISTLSQLSGGLQNVAAQALASGLGFDQMLAAIGRLNDKGVLNERAGSALSATLRELPEASKKLDFTVGKNAGGGVDLVATLENIRAKYGDLNKLSDETKIAFQKAFGDEGLKAVQLLSSELGVLKTKQAEIAQAAKTNATEVAAAKIEQSTGGQIALFDQQMLDLKNGIGKDFIPILKDLLPIIRDVLKGIADFVKENPDLTKWGLAIGALASPVASFAGAVSTLGGGALKLADHFNLFEKLAVLGKGGFAHLGEAAAGLTAFGPKLAGALKSVGAAAGTAIKAHPILAAIFGAVALGMVIYDNKDAIKAAGGKFVDAISSLFSGLGDKFSEIGSNIIGGLMNGIKSGLRTVMGILEGLGIDMPESLKKLLKIKSPSRVFMAIGHDIGRGLVIGIADSEKAVRDAVAGLGQTAIYAGDEATMMMIREQERSIAELSGKQAPVSAKEARNLEMAKKYADGATIHDLSKEYGLSEDWVKKLVAQTAEADTVFGKLRSVGEKAFQGIEDALVTFVTTGKLSFKSLANSIISDLVRIAIQESIMKPMRSAMEGFSFATMFASAKGNVFSGGSISAWSNQIVDKPTFFAMGGNVMGEAGPEAIMPLKRGPDGSLGVRGGGTNVTVNVINTTAGTKATQQTRSDGNGNKIIDVLIEQVKGAIAGDISRGSGPVSGALASTYGLNRVAGAY